MIAPLAEADVDIFVILDGSYWSTDGQATLLDRVRRVLLRTYETSHISRNGQAVTIVFNDFKVDVVPAFRRNGGGFLIPNSVAKTWIQTDPRVHEQVMSALNGSQGGNLIPVVKMIKAWNRVINRAFVSFYLEMMAYYRFIQTRIEDDPTALLEFFDKGREHIKYQIKDPAGFGGEIPGLQNISPVSEAVSRFQTAYERALRAVNFDANGKPQEAIGEWQKIFGNYFPAYG